MKGSLSEEEERAVNSECRKRTLAIVQPVGSKKAVDDR